MNAEPVLSPLRDLLAHFHPKTLIRLGFLVVVGVPASRLLAVLARGFVGRTYGRNYGLIAGKAVFYGLSAMIVMSALQQLGFSLAPLLGAAGVLGIALGFASQTSVSNVISGLFLLAERSFEIDDILQVGDTTGEVVSIDTLSVKVRTFDNKFVRIPNETLVKEKFVNFTHFPLRRFDLRFTTPFGEDIARVRETLYEAAQAVPVCLEEPEPMFFVDGFTAAGIAFQFSAYAKKDSFIELKNELSEEVKRRFDRRGIVFARTPVLLGADSASAPLAVRLAPETPEGGKAS